ncbi:MAG: alpha/beta hydrolase [Kiritimatiellaeota bacterium]|nr:alpha/beta hydrolase [Kiritimatiellota bacterium]
MKKCVVALTLVASFGSAEPSRELLYPGGAPGAKGEGPEHEPALTWYPAPAEGNTGIAVVICPGGGYGALAMGHEGHDIAKWLNGFGVTGVILEYRMSRGGYRHPVPLQDAQRAIRTVRASAAARGVNPSKIGIMGFSAGGHLTSTALTHFDNGDAGAADAIGKAGCRPDFGILCYPVIALGEPFTHRGSQENLLGKDADEALVRSLSSEKQVTAETPPTFIFQTDEDAGVPAENAVAFYLALRKAKVPAEIHVFQKGHHGIGLGQSIEGTRAWPPLLQHWILQR